jgi:hypothetical protein
MEEYIWNDNKQIVSKGLIKSSADIFGISFIGYGDSEFSIKEIDGDSEFSIKEIDRDKANSIVVANHYSKKFYSLSYIHLGVYIKSSLVGVLQFGYAMNPASGSSVVTGTEMDQYLELNRMWLDDIAPRNSESKAISYAIKFIKNKYKRVKWIQSFADERCGGYGLVYQAANFDYYGEHNSKFWELDGAFYHNSSMTRDPSTVKSAKFLQENRSRAEMHVLRQFRYLYWIDRSWKSRCTKTQ